MDLMLLFDYSDENDGYRYLLNCIDVFSRYAWSRPLKSKTGKEVAIALESIFEEANNSPEFLQSDRGVEFYNEHVKSLCERYEVELFSTNSEFKASIAERFNRTIRGKIYKFFTYQGRHRWIDKLQDFIHSYNNTYHRSIKTKPINVKIGNQMKIWREQYYYVKKPNKPSKFNIGDRVRISKYRRVFDHGYLPNWTNEEFIIQSINEKYFPYVYYLKDMRGNIIQGGFYEQELQLVNHEFYRIERIIQKRGNQSLVKFIGYEEPEWIPSKNITSMQNAT